LRDGATRRTGPDLYTLLTHLRTAGIPAAGGGRFGDQDMILIDQITDAERAIDILAKLGIVAERA
jgi:hypothetical protein